MITNPELPFSVAKLKTGLFLVLGENSKRIQILYLTSLEKNDVSIDQDSVLDYGPHCRCYPVITLTNAIIGSLLVIDKRYLDRNAIRLVIRNKEEAGSFSIHQVEGVGGLMVFTDEYDNTLIVPSYPPQNKLTVVDQGDQIG